MRHSHSIFFREIVPRRYASLIAGLISLAAFLFLLPGVRSSGISGSWTIPIFLLVVGLTQLTDSAVRFASRARRKRRNDRFLANCCVHCGYELKGSNSPRCPECGTFHGRMPARAWMRLTRVEGALKK